MSGMTKADLICLEHFIQPFDGLNIYRNKCKQNEKMAEKIYFI